MCPHSAQVREVYAGSTGPERRLLLRPLTGAEARTGTPRGPVVCAPEAKLTPADTTVPAGGSTSAELTVTNPCDTPLRDVTAAFGLAEGWTATPGPSTSAISRRAGPPPYGPSSPVVRAPRTARGPPWPRSARPRPVARG
ncbi:hypothetical protein [Streptomyces malaysiensis]|uniref:hypothetical protein n=1 Tax=Streptomyces malaysiensis TaxID=92644 RepID=UPI0037186058